RQPPNFGVRRRRTPEVSAVVGYYMRYISTDQRRITAAELRDALLATGPGYQIQVDDTAATIAHVEINVPGDGLFDEERDELIAFAANTTPDPAAKDRVLQTLQKARAIVATQVLFGTGETESTLRRLDPLWAWLFRNRQGLLQAEGEGYYDVHGLVLRMGPGGAHQAPAG